ncbi:MAG: hypothetical protein ACPGVO_24325 [Spirulinaceae cyanobacterium]
MFILNAQQVEFCLLHNPTTNPTLHIPGIQFQQQVYAQGQTYRLQDKADAVRDAQAYQSAGHEPAALLVQDQAQLTFWYVDPALRKVDDPLEVDLEQLVTVMRQPKTLPWETESSSSSSPCQWFKGSAAVDWLSQHLQVSRLGAVQIGQQLLDHQLLRPVSDTKFFEDSPEGYWFCPRPLDPTVVNLAQLVQAMQAGEGGVSIQDRRYHLRTYRQCFVGSEAVTWLSRHFNVSRENAIAIGQRLHQYHWLAHVHHEHSFKDEYLFYRFCERE